MTSHEPRNNQQQNFRRQYGTPNQHGGMAYYGGQQGGMQRSGDFQENGQRNLSKNW